MTLAKIASLKPAEWLSVVRRQLKYGYSLLAMLTPAALQFLLFAFYARVLGVEQYGVYIALLSWNPICFEIVGLGAGEYLVKRVARDQSAFAEARAHLMAALIYTLPVAMGLFSFLALKATHGQISLWVIIPLCFCEFLGFRLMVAAEQTAIAMQRFGLANWFRAAQGFPRIVGAILAWAIGFRDVASLALAGATGIFVGGIIAEVVVRAKFKAPSFVKILPEGVRDGTWFAGSQLVRAGQQNIDRVVLSALVDPTTLALYGTAQRFVQVGMLPLQTVLRYTYPNFFKEGKHGAAASLAYGLKVMPMVLGVTLATVVGLILMAGLLPLILGKQYSHSVVLLYYLAPVLLLFACNYLATDALSGSGHLFLRAVLTASGVALQGITFALFHQGYQIVLASYLGMGLSCLLTWGSLLWFAIGPAKAFKQEEPPL